MKALKNSHLNRSIHLCASCREQEFYNRERDDHVENGRKDYYEVTVRLMAKPRPRLLAVHSVHVEGLPTEATEERTAAVCL